MPLSSTEQDQIRTTLLLELNPGFEKVSRHLEENGDDHHREFLQNLIASVTECVNGQAPPPLEAES